MRNTKKTEKTHAKISDSVCNDLNRIFHFKEIEDLSIRRQNCRFPIINRILLSLNVGINISL